MKRAVRGMSLIVGFGLIVMMGLLAVIRLAPIDLAEWHIELVDPRPVGLPLGAAGNQIVVLPNGAYASLGLAGDAINSLAKIDAIALATPRTRRIAGSVAEGHMTWETRSLVWGFPDYTTAEVTAAGLVIYARQRFGTHDWGVNAARLRAWLAQL